jgi:hypothetical protein
VLKAVKEKSAADALDFPRSVRLLDKRRAGNLGSKWGMVSSLDL